MRQFDVSHFLEYPARFLRNSEHKLNREKYTPPELQLRGTLFVIIAIVGSLLGGWLFSLIFSHWIFTLLLLVICLPIGSNFSKADSIKKNLQVSNLPAARAQLQGTVFRHYAVMDAPSLARATAEYLAIEFMEKIIAPIFWFLLLGVAGLFAAITTSLLHQTIARASNKSPAFGITARNAYFFVNYIPSRLTVFLCVIASLFLPTGNWREVIEKTSPEMLKSSPVYLTLLCAASCLNLSLGGRISGYMSDSIVGNGRTNPSAADITRAQYLFVLLCSFLFVGIGFFA